MLKLNIEINYAFFWYVLLDHLRYKLGLKERKNVKHVNKAYGKIGTWCEKSASIIITKLPVAN